MRSLNDIKIKTEGAVTHIFIDGKEIHNVKSVEFKHTEYRKLPMLTLNLCATNLEISADDITVKYIADKLPDNIT